MKIWRRILFSLFLIGSFSVAAQESQAPRPQRGDEDIPLVVRIYVRPLPERMPGSEADTPELIALGRKLYFERGISLTKTQSCNECHRLDHNQAGVDYLPTSKGAKGTFGTRNSPTVLNAGFQAAQFWDGRAADLQEQAKGPVLNPVEMAMESPGQVMARLKAMDAYPGLFSRAFPDQPDPWTYDNVARAIAAFERTLVTPSRFDRRLSGDKGALTEGEMRGLRFFAGAGCMECHVGQTFGGRLFKKFGVYHPYLNAKDEGRKTVSGREEDRSVFKVPMLRNVTLTPPYFHDGGISGLEEAVRLMGRLQLDKNLSTPEIIGIVQFFHSLEAERLPDLVEESAIFDSP